MPCYCPLTAYYGQEIGKSGKRGITFDRNASFSGISLKLPCGQCVGCRLERSRQWAIRCMHEKQLHAESCFITLTYDDEFLPEGGSLVKRDLQLFFKRLRKRVGSLRFYACGEYGETFGRPHYHALIFGYDFLDKKFFKRAKRDEVLYTSKLLSELWPWGHNVIGDVSFDSAAYVARYIVKKITGDAAEEHYQVLTSDGEIIDRCPEFTNMSRKPGIGALWFAKYGEHAYKHDSVIMNGKEIRPPRFYDTRFEVVDSAELAALKLKRRRKALKHREDNTPDRRRVREIVELKRLAQSKRDLR